MNSITMKMQAECLQAVRPHNRAYAAAAGVQPDQ